jgi:hypothetical protein
MNPGLNGKHMIKVMKMEQPYRKKNKKITKLNS